MAQTIHFILTGGTIDGCNAEKNLCPQESNIPDYINNKVRPYFLTSYSMPFIKDSSDMTAKDREAVLDIVLNSPEKYFVITHGTDTMIETALLLKQRAQNKTIILTGAFEFLSQPFSDGGFNLGFACHAALTQSPGVYIASHGILFDPENAKKNHDLKRFEELKDK